MRTWPLSQINVAPKRLGALSYEKNRRRGWRSSGVNKKSHPFASLTSSSKSVINISSGRFAAESTSSDLNVLTAHAVGETQLDIFVKERVLPGDKSKSVFDPIKCVRLKNFAHAKPKFKAAFTVSSIKEDNSLFTRLLVISQVKDLDFADIMSYNPFSIPHAIGTMDGYLTKTNKAEMRQEVTDMVPLP